VLLDPEPMAALAETGPPSDAFASESSALACRVSGLLGTASRARRPLLECVAACDLTTAGKRSPRRSSNPTCDHAPLPGPARQQELDCIIAAVPDHWHKQIVVDTVALAKTLLRRTDVAQRAEGFDMAAAQKKTPYRADRSQRVSSVVYAKARDMIAKGAIGDVNLVEGTLAATIQPVVGISTAPIFSANARWDTWQGAVPITGLRSSHLRALGAAGKSTARASLANLLVHLVSAFSTGSV